MLSEFRSVLAGDVAGKCLTALSIFLAIRYLSAPELAAYIYFAGIAAAAYAFFNGFFNRQYIFDNQHDHHIAGYRLSAALLTVIGCTVVLAFSDTVELRLWLPTLVLAAAAMDYEFKRTILQKAGRFRAFAMAESSRAALFFLTTVVVILAMSSDRPALLLAAQALSYLVVSQFLNPPAMETEAIRTQVRAILSKIFSIDSAMLMLYFILVGLFGQLPILLYKPMATDFQYAELGSAFRYFGLLVSVATAVNVVSLPKIAGSTLESTLVLIRSMKRVFGVSVLLVAAAVAAGFIAIPIVDGGAYPEAPVHFAILSTATLIGVFVGPLSGLYLRWGRLAFLLATQIVALGTAAAVILLLADRSSYWAASALSIGILTQLCALLAGSRRAYHVARAGAR